MHRPHAVSTHSLIGAGQTVRSLEGSHSKVRMAEGGTLAQTVIFFDPAETLQRIYGVASIHIGLNDFEIDA